MRNHAPHLATLLVVAYAVACASPGPPAKTASIERVESVPETPPSFRPPTLDDDLVPDANGDRVSTTVLSVTFAVGATQAERQAAIDLVDGTVIGGVNRRGDGWYYVRVEGDGTIETIFEIAHTLNALPQVALAGPYTAWGS
jgi:hypothetical protein